MALAPLAWSPSNVRHRRLPRLEGSTRFTGTNSRLSRRFGSRTAKIRIDCRTYGGHQPIQKLKKRRWGHRMSDGSRNDEDEVHRDGRMLAVLLLTIALIIYVGWNVI